MFIVSPKVLIIKGYISDSVKIKEYNENISQCQKNIHRAIVDICGVELERHSLRSLPLISNLIK